MAVARGNGDAGVGRVLTLVDVAAELKPAGAGLKDIAEDELRALLERQFQAARAILGLENGPTPILQPGCHCATEIAISIYDQTYTHAALNRSLFQLS